MYYLDIDGVIDNFGQGGTGDCWLLSGLKALSASEKGRQLIRDAIHDNGDGSFTVTLKPFTNNGSVFNGWTGTFSYDDIVAARKSGNYSSGDIDVLLMEMAIENSGIGIGPGGSIYIIGPLIGSDYVLLEFRGLTPEKLFDYKYDDFKNGKLVLTFSCWTAEKATDIYGKEIQMVRGHEYAVTDINKEKNTVTIVNPWCSDKPIVLSWEEFSRIYQSSESNNIDCFYFDKKSIEIDDIFTPYINGDINEDDLLGTFFNLSCQNALSDEQKQYILDKAESLGSIKTWLLKIYLDM